MTIEKKEYTFFFNSQLKKIVTGRYGFFLRLYIGSFSNFEHVKKIFTVAKIVGGINNLTYINSFLLDCLNIAIILHNRVEKTNILINLNNKINILIGDLLYTVMYKLSFETEQYESFKIANKSIKNIYMSFIHYQDFYVSNIKEYEDWAYFRNGIFNELAFKLGLISSNKINDSTLMRILPQMGKNIGILESLLADLKMIQHKKSIIIKKNNFFLMIMKQYPHSSLDSFTGKKRLTDHDYEVILQGIINNGLNEYYTLFNRVLTQIQQDLINMTHFDTSILINIVNELEIESNKEVNKLLDYDKSVYSFYS